jgi:hypothetical protein
MSNFHHWTTDSLRDKLQILPIFVFIFYQMDKSSGICIVSPNTKSLALHSRVVLALKFPYSSLPPFFLFCVRVKYVYVVFGFFGCTLFINAWAEIFGFLLEVKVGLGFCVLCTYV